MLDIEQEPKKKKKPGLLSEKMGLDQGSTSHMPPKAAPGILTGSPESDMNARNSDTVGDKVQEKLGNRRKQHGR
jgi:hypothetical protein